MVPPALLRKPVLDVVLVWYWDEFNNLAHDRRLDQGYPTPLTTGQIETYCRFFNIPWEHEFHDYMRTIDTIYLIEFFKRKKAESAKS